MPTLILPKGALITINSTDLSDHNRQALEITNDDLKSDNRTATGLLRRYYVASKRKFSIRWDFLPALDNQTVDGKAGRNSLRDLYESLRNTSFTLTYKEVDDNNNQVGKVLTCFIESYSETLVKRFDRQFWNVTMNLVEQ